MNSPYAILLGAGALLAFAGLAAPNGRSQTRTYPDKIRGYKVVKILQNSVDMLTPEGASLTLRTEP
jgi:hypothetical protein